mmetsp:Transcript_122382/g.391563  ORF Transcript_122382/g.391563 Transcript_122382/m.391563 type:complete len:386 (-) Transcript_122382:1209-2366(-)
MSGAPTGQGLKLGAILLRLILVVHRHVGSWLQPLHVRPLEGVDRLAGAHDHEVARSAAAGHRLAEKTVQRLAPRHSSARLFACESQATNLTHLRAHGLAKTEHDFRKLHGAPTAKDQLPGLHWGGWSVGLHDHARELRRRQDVRGRPPRHHDAAFRPARSVLRLQFRRHQLPGLRELALVVFRRQPVTDAFEQFPRFNRDRPCEAADLVFASEAPDIRIVHVKEDRARARNRLDPQPQEGRRGLIQHRGPAGAEGALTATAVAQMDPPASGRPSDISGWADRRCARHEGAGLQDGPIPTPGLRAELLGPTARGGDRREVPQTADHEADDMALRHDRQWLQEPLRLGSVTFGPLWTELPDRSLPIPQVADLAALRRNRAGGCLGGM